MEKTKFKFQDVLFQKLGNKWYLFTEGEEDLLYFDLPEGLDPTHQSFDLLEIVNRAKGQQSEKSKSVKSRVQELF